MTPTYIYQDFFKHRMLRFYQPPLEPYVVIYEDVPNNAEGYAWFLELRELNLVLMALVEENQ
jgi:hypothetical protein